MVLHCQLFKICPKYKLSLVPNKLDLLTEIDIFLSPNQVNFLYLGKGKATYRMKENLILYSFNGIYANPIQPCKTSLIKYACFISKYLPLTLRFCNERHIWKCLQIQYFQDQVWQSLLAYNLCKVSGFHL